MMEVCGVCERERESVCVCICVYVSISHHNVLSSPICIHSYICICKIDGCVNYEEFKNMVLRVQRGEMPEVVRVCMYVCMYVCMCRCFFRRESERE
jgi:hypothetical protein